jgi:arginase family enzyme
MPEPGGLSLDETELLLRAVAGRRPVLGAGLSGLAAEASNVERAMRLLASLAL